VITIPQKLVPKIAIEKSARKTIPLCETLPEPGALFAMRAQCRARRILTLFR
jgi:hypothetical protein